MSVNPPYGLSGGDAWIAHTELPRQTARLPLLPNLLITSLLTNPRQVLLWFYSSLTTILTMLRSRVTWLSLAAALLASSTSHGQQLTQYAHTAWRFQEGVFDASPVSIAQTTDGFLWIGTLNGLIRFDGVHFESWNDRFQQELHTCCALSLLGSSDGSLWIGTSVGLAKLNGGKLSAVTNGDARYNSMIEDRKGRIWAARTRIRDNKGPLCEVEGTQVQCHGEYDGLGCHNGNVLAQDDRGTVWVGDAGKICSWNNGAAAIYSAPAADAACKPAIEAAVLCPSFRLHLVSLQASDATLHGRHKALLPAPCRFGVEHLPRQLRRQRIFRLFVSGGSCVLALSTGQACQKSDKPVGETNCYRSEPVRR